MTASQYSIVIDSQELKAIGINWPNKEYIRLTLSKERELSVENIREIFGIYLARHRALNNMSLELEKYEKRDFAHMQPISRLCQITLLFWGSYKIIKERYGIISFEAVEKKPPSSSNEEGFNCSPNLPS